MINKKILFNNNQIEYDTGHASLIKVPNSMKKVWIPDSMIWPYKGRNAATVCNSFSYHTAGGNSMSADELITKFGHNVVEIEYNRPQKMEAKHVEANNDLKR